MVIVVPKLEDRDYTPIIDDLINGNGRSLLDVVDEFSHDKRLRDLARIVTLGPHYTSGVKGRECHECLEYAGVIPVVLLKQSLHDGEKLPKIKMRNWHILNEKYHMNRHDIERRMDQISQTDPVIYSVMGYISGKGRNLFEQNILNTELKLIYICLNFFKKH